MLKKKIIQALKILFFLGLGIFLIWWKVKDISDADKKNIYEAFSHANYFWIVVSVLLGLISNISRSLRWKQLLEPLGYNPRLSNTFFAVTIGYMANYAFPRLGEVSRCGILNTYEKVPFERSFGTVVAERLIDVITMLLLLVLTLIIEFNKIYGMVDEKILSPLAQKLSSNHTALFIVLGVGLVGIVVLFLLRKKIIGFLTGKIGKVILGFLEGLKSIKDVKKPGLFIAHSLFIWLMYFLGLYCCFFCFAETSILGPGVALAVLVMGTFGIIFTPGGIGAYQAIVIETLSAYKIIFSVAFAFAWIVWTSQFLSFMISGLISLVLLPIVNKSKSANS